MTDLFPGAVHARRISGRKILVKKFFVVCTAIPSSVCIRRTLVQTNILWRNRKSFQFLFIFVEVLSPIDY